ncbi:uncharacterized protein HMPREF1541_06080 [Cyphellophora europaea CBS 101466]|uniref:Uncharacterized protein n=1 Tax=Cyphellophora europaea (strain CBS 101466) TaxID=1220924 RepID=W2RVY2_CYPE1|nr:uncharacterized protein HMPREF1541_06080 [Cyphellophora europaea CBS 101466]ETN39854.1 hypothetical protein HMPREF1541_06080 [Cyphellophora europaea CBS 101466]
MSTKPPAGAGAAPPTGGGSTHNPLGTKKTPPATRTPTAKPRTAHASGGGGGGNDDEEATPFRRDDTNTTTLSAEHVPRPNANYSHVIRAPNHTLYLCGWMGDEPGTGKILHKTSAQGQMQQIMRNISACLAAEGSGLEKIVRRRVYLLDMADLKVVDRVWGEWVQAPFPVSTAVGVTGLAKEGARVEVEVEAVV